MSIDLTASRPTVPSVARWIEAIARHLGDALATVGDGALLCECADGRACR
jgi:hypothetical protein